MTNNGYLALWFLARAERGMRPIEAALAASLLEIALTGGESVCAFDELADTGMAEKEGGRGLNAFFVISARGKEECRRLPDDPLRIFQKKGRE